LAAIACPACGGQRTDIFYAQDGVPVHSCLLMKDPEAARAFPTGSIRLAFCATCGFIFNCAFDAGLQSYSTSYEETQSFSPRFRAFARELAGRWVDRHDLHGKHVLEIGCGKAEFLVLLCELGGNRGTGIDPGVRPERVDGPAAERIELIQDFYRERYGYLAGDAVVCRHTLEHILPVADFLGAIRASIANRLGTAVLFELPDVLRVLREVAFWDVYYEHCSYFSAGSLARLFRRTGFEVDELVMEYDGQYLVLDAHAAAEGAAPVRPPLPLEESLGELEAAVEHFSSSAQRRIEGWRHQLDQARGEGGRAVIWGSGSKGVSYLTTLGLREEIDCVVDINPYRQGMYMPGTGHAIVAPEALRGCPPDVIVAMNPTYRNEISAMCRSMGIGADLLAV